MWALCFRLCMKLLCPERTKNCFHHFASNNRKIRNRRLNYNYKRWFQDTLAIQIFFVHQTISTIGKMATDEYLTILFFPSDALTYIFFSHLCSVFFFPLLTMVRDNTLRLLLPDLRSNDVVIKIVLDNRSCPQLS